MSEHQFSVDLGGMISVLSDHLYSSPDVFLRELLQNGADAISMRKERDEDFDTPEINVVTDGSTLTFTDNGTGLTEEEVHKFVSVIGQSSKRGEGAGYIGRFGIGLLSCFIVTDEIVLRSRSVKAPDEAVEWHGFADGRYSVRQIDADRPFGSSISFAPKKGSEKYFNADFCEERLRYYGLPMPFPIYVSADGSTKTRANILYIGDGSDEKKFVLETGKRIFGTDRDFLDYIPLTSPDGLFSGAAYILPYSVSPAAGSDDRHRIYLKNMLLTENGSTLLPEWAFFVRCFINTDKLRPTASREDFYRDDMLLKAKEQISECISEYLERLSGTNRGLLSKIVELHGVALRSIACENEQLLRIFMPYFGFETSFGNVNGNQLIQSGRQLYYVSDIDIFRQLKPIFSEADRVLINTAYVHSLEILEFAERLGMIRLQKLSDNVLSDTLSDCEDEKPFEQIKRSFNTALRDCGCKAVIKSFEPSQVSAIFSQNANADTKSEIKRSKENSDSVFGSMLGAFEQELEEDCASLFLNSKSPLIQRLAQLEDRDKLHTFAKILYIQSLISGGYPVYSKQLNIMNENLIKLIEWGI